MGKTVGREGSETMIDFDYTAPELLPQRIQEVLYAPNEPHKIGGVVYVPKSDDKTKYDKLFGTPERAAWTICQQLKHYNICICDGCPVKPPNKECNNEYDALLKWLRSDME